MCSAQNIIEKAKEKIDEEVEFRLPSQDKETEMQTNGELAKYDFNHDIIFYSNSMMESLDENLQIQTFIHELAHVKDLRACVRNGLLKVLEPVGRPIFHTPWMQLNDIMHNATEFQVSNFLYSEFGYQLPPNYNVERSLHEPLSLSLIPAIEYLCFGEDTDLKKQFDIKLNKSLDSRWLFVNSLLKELGFANAFSFEKGFLNLADCFGFKVRMKTIPIEGVIRRRFNILQNSGDAQIKIFEMVDFGAPKFNF